MMLGEAIPGIALENKTAFIEEDGKYKVMKADQDSRVYVLNYCNGTLQKEELHEGWVDIQSLK